LAQASFGKPITRATAASHLSQVVDRARHYNADPGHLLTVAELAVFGSYLDTAVDRLGDLDLAITIVRRETDGDRYVEKVLEYAHASGRRFGVFIEELFWPSRELLMVLKNRSPAIGYHPRGHSVAYGPLRNRLRSECRSGCCPAAG
jgi:hypothetical protein